MAGTAVRGRLTWQVPQVSSVLQETDAVRTIELEVPDWLGHQAGQHLDVRLTADDGYTAERSYSIATADAEPVAITVERLEDGEVSPYLTGELRAGDQLELRGPIGRWFVWDTSDGGPLVLIAGGSGVVPLPASARVRLRARPLRRDGHREAGRLRLPGGPGQDRTVRRDLMGLDGNAIGGLLQEVFGTDMTDAEAACATCGATGPVAETVVYLRGPGTVVRCRNCSGMLMVISQIRGVSCVDLGGLTALDPRVGG